MRPVMILKTLSHVFEKCSFIDRITTLFFVHAVAGKIISLIIFIFHVFFFIQFRLMWQFFYFCRSVVIFFAQPSSPIGIHFIYLIKIRVPLLFFLYQLFSILYFFAIVLASVIIIFI